MLKPRIQQGKYGFGHASIASWLPAFLGDVFKALAAEHL
jgi:hypothetical protein